MLKKIWFLSLCIITQTQAWSLNEIAADTSETISSWFTKQQKQTSSKEYPIKKDSSITLINHNGSISITTWNKPILMVEATKRGSEQEINITSFSVTIEDSAVTIATHERTDGKKLAALDYALMIPRTASLTITTESGNITTQENQGDLILQALDGSISIEQSSKTVRAKAPNGSITLEQRTVPAESSIFLEADRDIILVIPENANTRINASTISGKISSDIFITLDQITTQLDKEAYKRMQKQVHGTTGAGGAPITLESTHGDIQIIGS